MKAIELFSGNGDITKTLKECDENNSKLFKLLEELDIPFIAENPRRHFRNISFTKNLYRITIYYSTYGAEYTKATDLFTNRKDLLKFFDTRYIRGSRHLDYSVGHENFLGRCLMPHRLIEDIVKAVKSIGEKICLI